MLPERPVFGAYLGGLFGSPATGFPRNCLKELPPLVLAPHLWGHQGHSLWVQFFCDNRSVTINYSQRFSLKGALGHLLRLLASPVLTHFQVPLLEEWNSLSSISV